MIEKIIEWSANSKFFIYLGIVVIVAAGLWALKNTPLDAIPDLSDVQVIVFSDWSGRSPDLVEDQVTYPIVTALISAPHVKLVRGYSFFGLSFVYVIFEDSRNVVKIVGKIFRASPNPLPIGVIAGRKLREQKKLPEAKSILKSVLKISDSCIQALNELSKVYYELGDHDAALNVLRQSRQR